LGHLAALSDLLSKRATIKLTVQIHELKSLSLISPAFLSTSYSRSRLFERYLKRLRKYFQLRLNKLPIELITVDLNTLKEEILIDN